MGFPGFRTWGVGFEFWVLGWIEASVQDLGFGVIYGLGFRIWGLGFWGLELGGLRFGG